MKIMNKYEEDENEFYHDVKIKSKDVLFPSHKENQNGKVTVWNLNDNK
jgi:hypothetical protein